MCSAPERLLIWYATQKMCTLNQYLSILRFSRCAYAQHLKYMLWAYDIRNIFYLPIQMCICSASVMRSITLTTYGTYSQDVHMLSICGMMCVSMWICSRSQSRCDVLVFTIRICHGIYWRCAYAQHLMVSFVCVHNMTPIMTDEVYEITCWYHPASEEWSNNYLPRKTRYHSCLKIWSFVSLSPHHLLDDILTILSSQRQRYDHHRLIYIIISSSIQHTAKAIWWADLSPSRDEISFEVECMESW